MSNLQPSGNSGEFTQAPVTQFSITKGIYTSGMLKTLKISPCSKLVLFAISMHYPNIYPSIEYLAEYLGISRSSVKNAIKELRLAGLIIYETRNVNHYKFTQKFFELVEFNPKHGKSCPEGSQNLTPNIKEQKNNKEVLNFLKSDSRLSPENRANNVHITGMNYPKFVPGPKIEKTPFEQILQANPELLKFHERAKKRITSFRSGPGTNVKK